MPKLLALFTLLSLVGCTSNLEIKPQTAADVQKGLDIAKAAYVTAGASVIAFCATAPKDDNALTRFCNNAPNIATDLGQKLQTLFDAIKLLTPVSSSSSLVVDPNTLWLNNSDKPITPTVPAEAPPPD